MKLIYASFLLLLLIPAVAASESVHMDDFEACVYYLEPVQSTLDAQWSFKKLASICDEIVNNGSIHIEREDQRDIIIIFTTVNKPVNFVLNNGSTFWVERPHSWGFSDI